MDWKTLARRALTGAVAGIAHPEAADEAAGRVADMVLQAGRSTLRQMGIVLDLEGADREGADDLDE